MPLHELQPVTAMTSHAATAGFAEAIASMPRVDQAPRLFIRVTGVPTAAASRRP